MSHENPDRKDLVGPVTSAVGLLVLKGAIQAIGGWIGLQLFKRVWDWIYRKFKRGKDGEGSTQEVPEEKS